MSAIRKLEGILWAALALLGFAYIVVVDSGVLDREAPAEVPLSLTTAPGAATETQAVAELPAPEPHPELPPIRIGWTAWSDAEVVTNIARRILEERMGYRVELVMADIGIQYQGLTSGDLDVMLMAWLPVTHANYWERISGDVVNLGPLYTRARLGWAVPTYVPEEQLSSLADLANPGVQEELRGEVQGIDPGSGLMQASERAIEAYGLDGIDLVSASGAAMTAALGRAVQRREWIVVTAWNPHWMFAEWQLRYLEDPQGVLGGRERIHALARQGFYQDFPSEVTEFFARMLIPLEDLEAAMLDASDTSVDEAVGRYLARHPRQVRYWVSGEAP
jgi:glycine betaine/proline transport system substrate-binding protein